MKQSCCIGLNKLLKKGELKSFVEAHPEFAWQHVEGRMLVSWVAGEAPNSDSATVAEAEPEDVFFDSLEADEEDPLSVAETLR